jgi:hypothetical protein
MAGCRADSQGLCYSSGGQGFRSPFRDICEPGRLVATQFSGWRGQWYTRGPVLFSDDVGKTSSIAPGGGGKQSSQVKRLSS